MKLLPGLCVETSSLYLTETDLSMNQFLSMSYMEKSNQNQTKPKQTNKQNKHLLKKTQVLHWDSGSNHG